MGVAGRGMRANKDVLISSTRRYNVNHTLGSVVILDIVFHFQSRQLFFATRKFGFRSSRVLFRWHMIQYDDVPFLHMETVEVV
jgi:hypothetical protein